MGIFNKKKPEKKVETRESKKGEVYVENPTKVNIDKDYPYIVQLNDIEDDTVIRRTPFGAKRYIDGANVWLVNEKIGFKEPFPSNNDDYMNYKLDEIESRLKSLNSNLEKLRKKAKHKTPEELDIIDEIKTFKSYRRSHLFKGRGGYMIISAEHGGRPLYTFDRKGNFKLPVYKNTDNSLLYTPSETDLATAGELLKLNDNENGIKDNSFKLITIGIIVILLLTVAVFGYLAYKTTQMPVELTDALTNLVNSNIDLTNKLNDGVQTLTNITSDLNPTKDVSVIPKKVNVNN